MKGSSILTVVVFFFLTVGFGAVRAQITQKIITTDVSQPQSVYAADLDGDSDQDVLSASNSSLGGKIAWYENENGSFSGQIVLTGGINGDIAGGESIHAADLTGNGALDVLFASRDDNKIAWFENTDGGFSSEQKVITTSANAAQSVYAADLDGDSDLDVLSASRDDNKIAWYENEGGGSFSEQKIITTDANGAYSVYAKDLTGDGNIDVLSASTYLFDDKIAWYENEGGGSFSQQKVISTNADAAKSVYAADLDGDSDYDVLSASEADNKVAWYENEGDGNFSDQKVITTSAQGAKSVHAVDLDGDSDQDILSASAGDDKIAWYENEGNGSFSQQKVVTASADAAQSVYAADLDGDSDQDVLSASESDESGGIIAWYENTEGVLPVELIGLSVRGNSTDARLTWQTASETKNAGFEVQRQKESGWTQIGFVDSKAQGGTTTKTRSYSFAAEDLPVGTHQFRLRQVDLDGSSTLTDPVSVDIQMQEALKLTAPAPNPASSSAALSFAVKEQSETTVRLYNTLGQQVATVYEGTPQAGEQQRAQVDVSGLSSGTYFLRLRADGKTATRRVTVVR